MAQSKNKRKNGKVVKKNDALTKRMRRMASYDLKDLFICSCVDFEEMTDEEARRELIPRSVIYNSKTEDVTRITALQERALRTERWHWYFHLAIVCRRQNGEVYLWQEEDVQVKSEVLLTDMNGYISDRLCELWEQTNPLHRLTMVWIATPQRMENPPLQAVLAPLHYFNVLGNMLTEYEQENDDLVVISYKAASLKDFAFWFVDQGRYKKELEVLRTVTFYFEETGEKMLKGQLQEYRKRIADVVKEISSDPEPFNPFAMPNGFAKYGKRTVVCKGVAFSQLMSALDKVPPCLNCVVELKWVDGRENTIKFIHGQEVKSYG